MAWDSSERKPVKGMNPDFIVVTDRIAAKWRTTGQKIIPIVDVTRRGC